MAKECKNKDLVQGSMCGSKEGPAVRELMDRIGDKWSILLVMSLSKMPKQRARFSELEKAIPGISQRMLTATLRNLERDGMLTREVFPEVPPRVEYELTSLGRNLKLPMRAIFDWVEKNWNEVKRKREEFDKRTAR